MKKAIVLIGFIFFPSLVVAQTYSKSERVFWLSSIWQDMKHYFCDPAYLQEIRWDSLYTSYIEKVEAVERDIDFYKTLQRFIANAHDGHTEVIYDRLLWNSDEVDRLPIGFEYIGRDDIIVNFIAKSLAQQIPVGSRIAGIQGRPTMEYLKEECLPLAIGRTYHDRLRHALDYLYEGKTGDSICLSIITPAHERRDEWIKYNARRDNVSLRDISFLRMYSPWNNTSCYLTEQGSHKYFYFKFDSFQESRVPISRVLEQMKEKIDSAAYVVVDLRRNSGGSELVADTLLSAFIDADTLITYPSVTRKDRAFDVAMGYGYPYAKAYYDGLSLDTIPAEKMVFPNRLHINKPLFVLIGNKTYSAAEDFVLSLKLNYPGRAVLVGMPTGGSTGAPLVRVMKDRNVVYRLCTRRPLTPQALHDDGLQPDYPYVPQYEDIINNRDAILDYVAQLYEELYENK